MKSIDQKALDFIRKLEKNNNRVWFQDHKDEWHAVRQDVKAFMEELALQLNRHDLIESSKLFRINRDIRFSKDKTPYNSHISMSFKRAGTFRRGGYFFKIKPGENFMAAGFWGPESADLKLIRTHLTADASPLKKILASKKFKSYFGELQGDKLKSAPRGFDKNHKEIELLKMKQFVVTRQFSNAEITDKAFLTELDNTYKAIRPFFDYMSDILCHDLNGEPLYEG